MERQTRLRFFFVSNALRKLERNRNIYGTANKIEILLRRKKKVEPDRKMELRSISGNAVGQRPR
jgi:hypothetical protein